MKTEESYKLSKLSNGLEFLYVPKHEAKSVFVSLAGKAGRRAEQDHEVGAAHFLEHLFLEGTETRPSALELNRFIQEKGAIRNATTGPELVNYFTKIIPGNAESAFDFISDIFQNSLLNEVEKERKVIAQEAVYKRDDPTQSLIRYRQSTLYPEQRIGRTIFDEEANLTNIDKDLITDYYLRNYTRENFLLTVAGGMEPEKAGKLAEKYFSNIVSGKEVKFKPSRLENKKTIDIRNQDLKQSKLSISFSGFSLNHPKSTAVGLLSIIIGGGQSSRLYDQLRNKSQLAYHVTTHMKQFSDTGFFSVLTFVDESNLQKTCDEIVDEIKKILKHGFDEEELEKAKNIYLSRLMFASEDVVNLADSYGSQYLLTGNIKTLDQKAKEVISTSADSILDVARIIFSDPPKVNVITPKLRKLEIGKIV